MSFVLFRRALTSVNRAVCKLPTSSSSFAKPIIAPFSSVVLDAEGVDVSDVPPPPEVDAADTSKLIKVVMPSMKVFKRDITQSPKKVRFLLKLVRGAWVPDALAQMKFTPKHKGVDVAALIRRAAAVLRASHDLIPEQLIVSEVLCTKGKAIRQMTIMGRGRTGFGYRRHSHIWLRLEQINFEKKIADAETPTSKGKWAKMEQLVHKLREEGPEEFFLQPPPKTRQIWRNRDAYDKPKPPRSR